MRIALYSDEGVHPAPRHAVHAERVGGLARMLRLLGHECVLVGRAGPRDHGSGPRHAAGTPVCLLPANGTWDPAALGAFLGEERPDAVWILEGAGAQDLLEAARARSVRVVADMHGLLCAAGRPPGDGATGGHPWSLEPVLADADAVVVRLPGERAAALRAGARPGQIEAVPFGAAHRPPPAAGDQPEAEATLRFCGPLAPEGGAHVLMAALKSEPELAVRVQIAGWPAGDAAYEERLQALVADDSRVTVAGVGAGEGFWALVVPAYAPVCPVVALDALASGRAVLASDASGIGQLAGGGGRSVFPATDPDALAALLVRAAEPGGAAGLLPVPSHVVGIETEALAMERVLRLVTDSSAPAAHARPARLVGGGIDLPHHGTAVPRAALQLTGWAVCDPLPVSRVEVELDGRPVGKARIGLARPVELGSFSSPEVAVCGFEHWIDLTRLPEDTSQVRLSATVVALEGTRFPLSPIDVTVEPAVVVPPGDEARAAVLRERFDNRVRPRPRRRAETVRMVAAGHDLGYGGAQLYLFELLRRLSEQPWFACTVVSPRDGPLRSRYEALGIPVHISDFPRVEDLDAYEGRQLEWASWIEAESFNVVLGNTLLAFPWIDLAERLGIPSLWPIHESYDLSVFWSIHLPSGGIHPLVHRRIEDALRSAAALVFVAHATRRLYARYADPHRLVKVDYGLDLAEIARYRASFDRAAARARLGIPQDADVMLCLGAVEPRKSQSMLAQAFAGIVTSHPDAFLAIVGDGGGEYAGALRRYLDEAGLGSRSRVVPLVRDTYEWYGVADLFVLPSDVESLPRSVLEAMAFGVPVAATRAFGVPELIEDGATGYLCDPRDLEQLLRLLERVLAEDAGVRKEIGRAGARLVARAHDAAGYADALGRLCRALVADPRVLPGDVLAAPAGSDRTTGP